MDIDRFDAFVLSLDGAVSRRGALAGVIGTGLTALLTRLGVDTAESKKKKKKKCKGGKKKCGKKCFDLQTDPRNCGTCGNVCDDDMVCRNGDCVCLEGETECGDTCCHSGQTCVNGECVCPDGETVCEEACCEAGLTCVDGQCEDLCPPELVCPLGQGCVDGDCTCPSEACAAAVDPTDDQFEVCSCDVTVEGDLVCLASIPCNPTPPPCTSSVECAAGSACQALSCGGVARCNPLCPLS